METLRVKEKRDLMVKLTQHLEKVLRYKIDVEKWIAFEVSELTGISPARITEILNFEKYQRPINIGLLIMAIKGDMISRDDVFGLDINDREKEFLKNLI